MNTAQASLLGALTGLLLGVAVCLIQAIPMLDSLLRIGVLTFAGAWMGLLLAWLNQLLPENKDESKHKDSGL